MNRTIYTLMTFALIFSLAACSSTPQSSAPSSSVVSGGSASASEPAGELEENSSSKSSSETPQESAGGIASDPSKSSTDISSDAGQTEEAGEKALVVYFSWSGNTESVAAAIQSQTGADVFEIVPAEPYTDDYNTLLDVAQAEQRSDTRPAISGSIENLEQYDTVFVGYPNWWGDMPMILYTFFDSYDLSGKTIAPFVTSGGSGFSNTISAMRSLEPGATIVDGLSLGSSAAGSPDSAVSDWLGKLGLAE